MENSSTTSPPRGSQWGAVSALLLLFAGLAMAFIALFLPPPGEIHESVLYIFAQILIYAGSVFGIDAYIKKLIDERKHKNGPTDE